MSVDREYNVRINLSANNAGAQTAAQGLQDVGKATDKVTDATMEGAKETEKFGLSGRALHQILHLIGRESGPEAEAAIAGVAAAGTGELIIFVLALQAAFEWMHKIKEKADQTRDSLVDMAESTRAAMDDAAKSAQDFADAMKSTTDESGELAKALTHSQAILAATVESHKAILAGIEKEQLAEAAGDKAKEDSIKRRFEALGHENDLVAESMKLEQIRDDLTERKFTLGPKLNEKALQAQADLDEEISNRAAADAAGRMKGKDEKKLESAANDARIDLARQKSIAENPNTSGLGKAEAQFQVAQREAAIKAFQDYERDAETVRRHTTTVETLTKAKDAAVNEYKANNAAIKDETEKVKTGEDILKIHRDTVRQQQALDTVDKAGGFANSGKIIGAGVSAIEAYQHGQKLNQSQAEAAATYRALFESVNANVLTMVQIAKDALAHGKSQAQVIAELQRDFANLKSASTRVSPTGQ
jgi:NTP pyrophosphatase (non-canonical NTP hydrolase)